MLFDSCVLLNPFVIIRNVPMYGFSVNVVRLFILVEQDAGFLLNAYIYSTSCSRQAIVLFLYFSTYVSIVCLRNISPSPLLG